MKQENHFEFEVHLGYVASSHLRIIRKRIRRITKNYEETGKEGCILSFTPKVLRHRIMHVKTGNQ